MITPIAQFFEACGAGDVEVLRSLLANDPTLARIGNPAAPHEGWTGLHTAAQAGHLHAVRVLLAHGADPNAREAGDNTYPLHWAAAKGHVDIARALLDAGGDVHGVGDVHELDVIGWATVFHESDRPQDVLSLLIERGARHHVFSAIAAGDPSAIRSLVEQDPTALHRRMSRFEEGQTPLHFAIARQRYDLLDLLIALGADLEAHNMHGRTAMDAAMLRGDQQAMRRLHAAGARLPSAHPVMDLKSNMAALTGAIKKAVPMIDVPDIAATLEWYTSIGFKEIARYADGGVVNFGMVAFGNAELMFSPNGSQGRHDMSFWLYTDRIDELYQLLRGRQIAAAHAILSGSPSTVQPIEFVEDLYHPFYGGRQFSVRDLNGYTLVFLADK